MPKLPDAVRDRLSTIDGRRDAAVVAIDTTRDHDDELRDVPVGVARWNCDDSGAAHMAIAVVDACQGEGLGRRLLHALFGLAVERGVRSMHAEVLTSNAPMRQLLKAFDGITTVDNGDPSVIAYEIDTVAAITRKLYGSAGSDGPALPWA
jgi:ribosomal protein S18 acetylase RimI-like enzyme